MIRSGVLVPPNSKVGSISKTSDSRLYVKSCITLKIKLKVFAILKGVKLALIGTAYRIIMKNSQILHTCRVSSCISCLFYPKAPCQVFTRISF